MEEHRIAIDPRSGEAYLAHSNVSVWALIAYLQLAVDGDIERTATDYEIPVEDVHLALDYYRQHRDAIDARILSNTPPSTTAIPIS